MNKRILQAEEKLKKAEDNAKKVTQDVQKKCKHPSDSVYEANYIPEGSFCYAQPPYRVCSKCGLAEIGWGIGWHILPATDIRIDRDKADEIKRYFIDQDEKVAICRGEKKLHQKKKIEEEDEVEVE